MSNDGRLEVQHGRIKLKARLAERVCNRINELGGEAQLQYLMDKEKAEVVIFKLPARIEKHDTARIPAGEKEV